MDKGGRGRAKIPVALQVRVLFRDRWLCHWCHRPTVFAPALKYLERFAQEQGYRRPLAYYDFHYKRDAAPMLDHLAAVIDHVKAYSSGGAHDESNFVTACNKCNMTKGNRNIDEWSNPGKPVKGKYGEPQYWDGFVSLFMILAGQRKEDLRGSEREWYLAFEEYFHSQPYDSEFPRTNA